MVEGCSFQSTEEGSETTLLVAAFAATDHEMMSRYKCIYIHSFDNYTCIIYMYIT